MDAKKQWDRVAANTTITSWTKTCPAQVVQEGDSLGNNTLYTHGDDLISQDRVDAYGSILNYYHYDRLGSTRSLTDSSGQTTDTYDYNAYGTVLVAYVVVQRRIEYFQNIINNIKGSQII